MRAAVAPSVGRPAERRGTRPRPGGRALQIAPGALNDLARHAEREYPREACGFLLGPREGVPGDPREITDTVGATNAAPDETDRRYRIAPREALRAEEEARARGRTVIGFYHSHPDRSAVPSAADAFHAWPGPVHLIVSVGDGAVPRVRAYEARDGDARLHEVALEIGAGGPEPPRPEE